MPYKLIKRTRKGKELYFVGKKDGKPFSNGRMYASNEPLPLERAKKQMSAIYASENGYALNPPDRSPSKSPTRRTTKSPTRRTTKSPTRRTTKSPTRRTTKQKKVKKSPAKKNPEGSLFRKRISVNQKDVYPNPVYQESENEY